MNIERINKILPIIQAFAKGEVIQQQSNGSGSWYDQEKPTFADNQNYRIKAKPKLVPFTFEDNLLFRDKWIRFGDSISKIQYINKTVVFVGANRFSYREFLNQAHFEDGSPCGKFVEE